MSIVDRFAAASCSGVHKLFWRAGCPPDSVWLHCPTCGAWAGVSAPEWDGLRATDAEHRTREPVSLPAWPHLAPDGPFCMLPVTRAAAAARDLVPSPNHIAAVEQAWTAIRDLSYFPQPQTVPSWRKAVDLFADMRIIAFGWPPPNRHVGVCDHSAVAILTEALHELGWLRRRQRFGLDGHAPHTIGQWSDLGWLTEDEQTRHMAGDVLSEWEAAHRVLPTLRLWKMQTPPRSELPPPDAL